MTDDNTQIDTLELAMLFRRTARLMGRAHHRQDHAQHSQEHALSIIRRRAQHGEGISQAELQEILDVRSSSLSELLAKLERSGRILRRRNPADKRGFLLEPSEAAGAEAPPEEPDQDEAMRQSAEAIFGLLDQEERRQLLALLQKLAAPLEAADSCGGEGFGPRGPHGRGGHGRGCGRGRLGGPGGGPGGGHGQHGPGEHEGHGGGRGPGRRGGAR